jgi:adenine-specific DNA-methyltransferase
MHRRAAKPPLIGKSELAAVSLSVTSIDNDRNKPGAPSKTVAARQDVMQNLNEDLVALLATDDRLVADGHVMKNKVVELALRLDAALLRLVRSHDRLRQHFFVDVDGVAIFDKVKFQQFVSNKAFLPDSYTAFKNKIGLMDGEQYLVERQDVVLAWPYKDCVLEGGQNREDAQRQEVFWNETLAPDQIDRLLTPKVLLGAKRYSRDGANEVAFISDSDSLIIKGNNLLALHTLKARFQGKVDLIYIDPPFNTENDSFRYNDRFSRSTWLSFMRSRLEVAKDLLSPRGTIYVHIDHNEGHYLKVLMDQIFGEQYFRNEIIWHYSGWNKKLSTGFERRHDTILMYGKSDSQYFESFFEKWESKEEYVKKRKQKLLSDEDGREYVLSDAGGGKRVKMYIEDVLKAGVVVDDVWHIDKLNNSAKESVGFQTQKTESLLYRIISASCPPGGIILDFHLGSGTTAAVAHKMGRQYIGIEQLDYIESVTLPRLKAVINGDQNGISREVDWRGGGDFVYLELAEGNARFIQRIHQCTTDDDVARVWQDMQERAFLSYRVDVRSIDTTAGDWTDLTLADKKRLLLETLDKNMLYVPLSELEDETWGISDADKALNRRFFGM